MGGKNLGGTNLGGGGDFEPLKTLDFQQLSYF